MVSNLNAHSIRSLSQLSADCSDPNCSGHGACVSGKCYCKAGWQGERCNQVDQQVYQCLPGCSDHGTYDLESAACVCEEHWTGVDCSQPSCGLDCGLHGSCEQGRCKSVYTYDAHTYSVLYTSSSFMGPPWTCCDRDFGIGLPVGATGQQPLSPGLNEESDACLNAQGRFSRIKGIPCDLDSFLFHMTPTPRARSLFNAGDLRNCADVATIYALSLCFIECDVQAFCNFYDWNRLPGNAASKSEKRRKVFNECTREARREAFNSNPRSGRKEKE